MKLEALQDYVERDQLTDLVNDYLTIYVGNADWPTHINTFKNQFTRRYGALEKDEAILQKFRNLLAYVILYPKHFGYNSINKEHPEVLLMTAHAHSQFLENMTAWNKELKMVVTKDIEIRDYRNQCAALGFVDPIDYHPFCRQAYNWLYQHADEAGAVTSDTKELLTQRLKNLVKAYGGAVICNVFSRNAEILRRVTNWRSGYFFERVIFDVYTLEQVMRIKSMELSKANEKLVRHI